MFTTKCVAFWAQARFRSYRASPLPLPFAPVGPSGIGMSGTGRNRSRSRSRSSANRKGDGKGKDKGPLMNSTVLLELERQGLVEWDRSNGKGKGDAGKDSTFGGKGTFKGGGQGDFDGKGSTFDGKGTFKGSLLEADSPGRRSCGSAGTYDTFSLASDWKSAFRDDLPDSNSDDPVSSPPPRPRSRLADATASEAHRLSGSSGAGGGPPMLGLLGQPEEPSALRAAASAAWQAMWDAAAHEVLRHVTSIQDSEQGHPQPTTPDDAFVQQMSRPDPDGEVPSNYTTRGGVGRV